jgi:hypothetical protein
LVQVAQAQLKASILLLQQLHQLVVVEAVITQHLLQVVLVVVVGITLLTAQQELLIKVTRVETMAAAAALAKSEKLTELVKAAMVFLLQFQDHQHPTAAVVEQETTQVA